MYKNLFIIYYYKLIVSFIISSKNHSDIKSRNFKSNNTNIILIIQFKIFSHFNFSICISEFRIHAIRRFQTPESHHLASCHVSSCRATSFEKPIGGCGPRLWSTTYDHTRIIYLYNLFIRNVYRTNNVKKVEYIELSLRNSIQSIKCSKWSEDRCRFSINSEYTIDLKTVRKYLLTWKEKEEWTKSKYARRNWNLRHSFGYFQQNCLTCYQL